MHANGDRATINPMGLVQMGVQVYSAGYITNVQGWYESSGYTTPLTCADAADVIDAAWCECTYGSYLERDICLPNPKTNIRTTQATHENYLTQLLAHLSNYCGRNLECLIGFCFGYLCPLISRISASRIITRQYSQFLHGHACQFCWESFRKLYQTMYVLRFFT